MKNIKCDNCGADMKYVDGQYKCPYCGGIKADFDKEEKEEAAEEAPARPLDVIRADYYSVYKKIKISFAVMIISAVAGVLGGIFMDISGILISPYFFPIGIFLFSFGIASDLTFGIFLLHYYFNRFISVGKEYGAADKQQENLIDKHCNSLVRIWWLRYVFIALPFVVYMFFIFI